MRKFISLSTISLLILSQPVWSYHNNDKKIVDENNNIVAIDGVNWAGFQDSGFVDEMYGAIPFYPIAKPYQQPIKIGVINLLKDPENYSSLTNVTKENSVSFKTIRLPISPTTLHDKKTNSHFRIDLTDAKDKTSGNGVFCKTWSKEDCAQPLTIAESFYQLIEEFKKNNIRVLIDFHQTPSGRTGNVVTNEYTLDHYKNDITELAKAIKEKQLSNVIGIDVFNEPHNLNWFTQNDSQPAWIDVIATAAQAVYENNPDLLLFVEGPSSDDAGPAICTFKANWGENFKPLLDKAAAQGQLKLGNELRHQLLKKTSSKVVAWLLGQENDLHRDGSHIVFSPHIYGKNVAEWQTSPEESVYRFNCNFGFLNNANYPVVIGETGYFVHGSDLHIMPNLPNNPSLYKNSFIYAGNQVIYINTEGQSESVTIKDINLFRQTLEEINKDRSTLLHLTSSQLYKLITVNGGYVLPKDKDDMDFFKLSIKPYLMKNKMNHNLIYWTFNTNSGDTGGVREDANTASLVLEKEQALHELFYASDK